MNKIVRWLEKIFSRPKPKSRSKSVIEIARQGARVPVVPDETPQDDYTIESSFDPAVPGRVVSRESGKNVLMPDIYANKYGATIPDLRIVGQSPSEDEESAGFDPYDTAVLREKQE